MNYLYRLILTPLVFSLALTAYGQQTMEGHRHKREGDKAYIRQQYEEAAQAYQLAKTFDKDAAANYNLGNARYHQGQFAEAETLFKEAAELAQTPLAQADAFHNLGNARFQQRQYAGAIEAFEKALRLRPGDAGTKINLQMAKKLLEKQRQEQQQQQPPPPPQTPPQQPDPPKDPNQPPPPKDPPPPAQQPQTPNDQIYKSLSEQDRESRKKYQDKQQKKRPKKQDKDW